MMMFGLLLAILGLGVAYSYSSLLGAVLFLVGAAILVRGYLKPEPVAAPPKSYESAGSITYNIPASKRR